jgi:hypothetical protein
VTEKRRPYRKWEPVIDHAAEIVASYDTGVTLRQLFYRLAADGSIRNERGDYSHLSKLTAERRRQGLFPTLIDPTRRVREPLTFTGPDQARQWLTDQYRRDRTEGQPVSVYLGVEKHGMAAQLVSWFGGYGLPILTLGGWASQTFVDEVFQHAIRQDRPAVFLYTGDFDPSGWFIGDERDYEGNHDRDTGVDGSERVARGVGCSPRRIPHRVRPGGDSGTRESGHRGNVGKPNGWWTWRP